MVTRCILLVSVCCGLAAGQDAVATAPVAVPAPDIPSLIKDGDAAYLKGDYDGARQAFLSAWDLAQAAPPEDPARYNVLKKLTAVRAAAGEFEDANQFLQTAIACAFGTPYDCVFTRKLHAGHKQGSMNG